MDPVFFASGSEFHQWLQEHHSTAKELWLGFYKKNSGLSGIHMEEAVAEAMCFGWVERVRKRIDDQSYMMAFVPRKPKGSWAHRSAELAEQLIDLGLMQPAGLAVYQGRKETRPPYSSPEVVKELSAEYQAQFRQQPHGWTWFNAQTPSYKKVASYWVMSAKREETRQRRLATLIEDSANGRKLAMLTSK